MYARVVKLVDTGDSKSPALTGVPVRVRPLVPRLFIEKLHFLLYLINHRLKLLFIPWVSLACFSFFFLVFVIIYDETLLSLMHNPR